MKKVFVLLGLLMFVGCRNKQINFDTSDPLALVPSVSWAVVTEPYIGFRKEMSWESSITKHCRKSEVFLVKGKSFSDNGEVWYVFDDGWLHQSCVQVYSNKLQAELAAENIKDK